MFANRTLVIATKHQKEQVMSPILENELGVKCIVPEGFDSDAFGTFTGEVERSSDAIATARKKCLQAMELTQTDLAIASEGSFGAHPHLFFVPAGDELVLLLDKKNKIEIVVRDLSTETNFSGEEVKTLEQLEGFLNKVNFPSQGVILKDKENEFKEVIKGLTEINEVISWFNKLLEKYGKVYIETDMRALFNPTRMKRIEIATHKLVEKIRSVCPNCTTPGFGIVSSQKGLPCSLCGSPTESILSVRYTCSKCDYSQDVKYPKGKMDEDPMYCNNCNP